MKIKAGYVNGNVHKMIKKKRCKKRANRTQADPMGLQRLFVSCREVFKGPGTVPCSSDVQKMCHILDCITPEDVGLCKDLPFFKPKSRARGTSRVAYTTIYQCKNFSMCIFFLPPTGVIPLHNHPGMTVFSKLLLGTVHIKAYDWADPTDSDNSVGPNQPRLAKLKADNVFTAPCDTSVLYPTSGGNIHSFKAITPCAILDVLGPPYSNEDGRDCSYYRDTPCTSLSSGETTLSNEEGISYGLLEEIEMPVDSLMEGIEYMGPQVLDSS
ncbi:hypothetical protein RHSIM_Rhsim03G0051000 [Rhododendron simsii]|uniref:cysteine dioxygenase n=1 Tax=Rhododendron simsii TaxID=118357 RepID=A0A834HDF5_RHOSS|nr:hypothetical protein RHSIM_Rhsim03G0051000 [Rhododendron simsii]